MQRYQAVIERIQGKGGESYADHVGSRKGFRNPIRRDTNDLLTALALAKQPQAVVEVGTAYGVSALCIAEGLVDGGRIVTFELSPEVAAEAQATFDEAGAPITAVAGKFEDVYEAALHDAGLNGQPMIAPKVGMVFFDAEKSAYLTHLQLLEPYLLPDALIVADNTIDRAEECRPFLEYLDEHYTVTTLGTECGLTVARRKNDA